MFPRLCILWWSLLCFGVVAPLRADWQVWTVADTRRVLREDPAADQLAVRLAAARNEGESFQILLRSDVPVAGVHIEPGDLAGPQGSVLPAGLARVYRAHQLHITTPTYRNEHFQAGWYPDALIPAVHPLTKQPLHGRFTAMPFALPAGETHGFWIDLYVPADALPGRYRGVYRVLRDGGDAQTIPVELTVWDFALPDTPTLQTAFGNAAQRILGYYTNRIQKGLESPLDVVALEQQVADMLMRHHINVAPPNRLLDAIAQPDGSFVVPDRQIDLLRLFIDRYHVNNLRLPHPSAIVKDPVTQRDRLHAWLRAWDQAAERLNRPQVVCYIYLCDEPNDQAAYEYVRKWGEAVRAAHSVVKVLVVEQTWTQNAAWGNLYGAVDIWCPLFPLFKEESAVQRQQLGESIWTYTALCQRRPTPWWQTDFPLLHYRVPAWIAWRYQIRGLLYWGGMSYWRDAADPWLDPDTLHKKSGGADLTFNGEGSLLYPARAVGFDGAVPSMRLKALRDASEDYEYLAILARRGQAAAAQKIVTPLADSFFHWNPAPQAYAAARRQLAELILASPAPHNEP